MKNLFKKSIACLLSLLVLVATTAFSASAHYCGEHLISFRINKTANSCFGKYSASIDTKDLFKASKKSCCKDVSILKKGSDDVLKSKVDVKLDKHSLLNKLVFTDPSFFETSFVTLIDPYNIGVHQQLHFQTIQDKTVLFQVFLI